MTLIIDEMPTFGQVEHADAEQIVTWHLFLRPTMANEELDIVKAIARRYEMLAPSLREILVGQARRKHG